jgi:oligoendopeptidase F
LEIWKFRIEIKLILNLIGLVYQYATGLSAALYLSEKVLHGTQKDRDDYLTFLKGGSSMPPIDLLKVAGVDMNSPEPVNRALKQFRTLVEELSKLLQSK